MSRKAGRNLILPVFLTLVLAGCGEKNHVSAPLQTVAVKGVTTYVVKAAEIQEEQELPGTVKSRISAIVSARIPGSVSLLKVREGDRVSKGQLLARIESQENVAQATGAASRAEEAAQALEEARTRKKLADVTFERFKKLYDEQAATRQEFDQRLTEKEMAHQAVSRAEAALKQAREGGKAAGVIADYTSVIAPVSGIVTMRQAEMGATVFPAQPMFTIEDPTAYQLEISVPETLSTRVRPGVAVTVSLDAIQYRRGMTVSEVVPAADSASRTFIAKIPLSAAGLKSGMFGRATLATGRKFSGIILPKNAVFERGALTSVWAIDNAGIARMRLVKPGKISGNQIEILSGLVDGDVVAVTGIDKIADGVKIER